MARWKRNSAGLTDQRQSLLEALALDGGEPKAVKAVAAIAGSKPASAASQLWYLKQRGYVTSTWEHQFAPGPRWLLTDVGREALRK